MYIPLSGFQLGYALLACGLIGGGETGLVQARGQP